MCKDLEALASLSVKENKDHVSKANCKRVFEEGPGNDLGGHGKNVELCSKCDGMSLDSLEQKNDIL